MADAGALLVRRDTEEVQELVNQGKAIPPAIRLRNRCNLAWALRHTAQAAAGLFEASGAGGLFLSNGVQRAWRDIGAMSQHMTIGWDAMDALQGTQPT